MSVLIIHGNFSYPTVPGWLPDPFFRIYLASIHRDKHGSDTGTYDSEGRFLPQKFEDVFAKYAEGRDYLTIRDIWEVLKGQRCILDPVGWGGAFFECESGTPPPIRCVLRTQICLVWKGADNVTKKLRVCYLSDAVAS